MQSSPSSPTVVTNELLLPSTGSRGSSMSSPRQSEQHNPFQFFDRIDQEIEENKQRLKEAAVPIIRPVVQSVGGGGGGGHTLDAVYTQSEAKQGGYNAFFNINFDQFSTKTLSTPVVAATQTMMTTTTGHQKKGHYTAFSNETPITTHKKGSGGGGGGE